MTPGVDARHTSSFRTRGSCIEYAAAVPVDAAKAQAIVPGGFTVLDAAGRGLVSVFAQRCSTSVDGGRARRSVVSGIFVFLNPASSPAGCQVYDWAWQDSVRSDWMRAYADLGWRTEVIGSAFTQTADGFRM